MMLPEFINDYRNHLREICKDHIYISFLLICTGIEFLGKCLDKDDSHDWHYKENNEDKKPFKIAIDRLMPKYLDKKIYQKVRNGMAHSLKPKPGIWLTERDKTDKPHLSFDDKYGSEGLIIVLEDFFQDFDCACDKVLLLIKEGVLGGKKIEEEFLLT